MKKAEPKTNAMRELEAAHIAFEPRYYDPDIAEEEFPGFPAGDDLGPPLFCGPEGVRIKGFFARNGGEEELFDPHRFEDGPDASHVVLVGMGDDQGVEDGSVARDGLCGHGGVEFPARVDQHGVSPVDDEGTVSLSDVEKADRSMPIDQFHRGGQRPRHAQGRDAVDDGERNEKRDHARPVDAVDGGQGLRAAFAYILHGVMRTENRPGAVSLRRLFP